MLRDENESSKVIDLNVLDVDDTQKNAPSKAKSRTLKKADQPVGLHVNNFPPNRACHKYYQATERGEKEDIVKILLACLVATLIKDHYLGATILLIQWDDGCLSQHSR